MISRLTRVGTAELVSRDQILRHERGQGNIHSPCSADHEQDWQPYRFDPFSLSLSLSLCVVIPFIVDVPAGVTQEEGHTGYFSTFLLRCLP